MLGLKYRAHIPEVKSRGHCSFDKFPNRKTPLDLIEHFVKTLRLGDTFNAVHLSVPWSW